MQYLLLGINIILLVMGQMLWKVAAGQIQFEISYKGITSCIFNLYFLAGGVLYATATVFWLYLCHRSS